ncbi:hypothetical protein D3H59_11555 [Micromonospora endophytica]|uniref:hypothetical protein n=1 Tax=Micromonospora endophytica TaxID=515350 RepID=UPI000E689103|nr:hypothetical protein [Micromonospora endophytica]RIW46882.1 hypothetical protein D3H59_11555 [Micromonospora endophytica]
MSGCAIGDIRRTRPAPSPSTVEASPPPGPPPATDPVAEIRRNRLAVPQRYDQPYVEFVDAQRGYALFSACDGQPSGPNCPALLWSTRDGGRSWQRLRHPQPVADNQQLYAVPGMLALLAEPHGWWTSTDGGRTFRRSPGPAEPARWQATRGRFQLIEATGKVGRWTGTKLRPLPAQPPLPALNTVLQADGRTISSDGSEYGGPVVAAGAGEDGKPYAAISLDEGRSWQQTPVPAPDGAVGVLRVVFVGGEPWLVGERPDRVGFPALWRQAGLSWELVRAEGHPATGQVVPLGAGIVAVLSPRGAGALVDGRYVDLPWPLTGEHFLRLLPDDTLFAAGPEGVLLGTGHFGDRTWTSIIIETQ